MKAACPLFALLATTAVPVVAEPLPGGVFTDCQDICPDMVVMPAGGFRMGMKDYDDSQKPVHKVTFAKPFAISRTEVTFAQWDACVADGACKPVADDGGGRGGRPVVTVSWKKAQTYIAWLSAKTGGVYRLPSEAEWEYVARIGLAPDGFGTGGEAMDNVTPNGLGVVGMYAAPNEWVQDCYHDTYKDAPSDGSAVDEPICSSRALRGGLLRYQQSPLPRATFRQNGPDDYGNATIGFRIARDM